MTQDNPSLCIPYVFNNNTETQIRNVLNELQIGEIKHIDILIRRNKQGHKYKRVYIHFYKWFHEEAKKRILEGKDIKIVYEYPWFWKLSANKWDENKKKNEEMHVPDYRNNNNNNNNK
jgi:hypothetical protein